MSTSQLLLLLGCSTVKMKGSTPNIQCHQNNNRTQFNSKQNFQYTASICDCAVEGRSELTTAHWNLEQTMCFSCRYFRLTLCLAVRWVQFWSWAVQTYLSTYLDSWAVESLHLFWATLTIRHIFQSQFLSKILNGSHDGSAQAMQRRTKFLFCVLPIKNSSSTVKVAGSWGYSTHSSLQQRYTWAE